MQIFLFLCLCLQLVSAQIRIGDEILNVEIADTHEKRGKGLMGRTSLKEGRGMLFIYQEPRQLVFWMKNTLIPLSIAFFDEERRALNFWDMEPEANQEELTRYYSMGAALYALEVPQGWFEQHEIREGMKFSFLDPVNELQ